MHTLARTGTVLAASIALLLGGLTACSSQESSTGPEEAAASGSSTTGDGADQTELVADIRWSEYITPEKFEERWNVAPDEAIYDASRTRYTTPEEFRKTHDGEDYTEWYPRVAKKDYEEFVSEKTSEIDRSADTE